MSQSAVVLQREWLVLLTTRPLTHNCILRWVQCNCMSLVLLIFIQHVIAPWLRLVWLFLKAIVWLHKLGLPLTNASPHWSFSGLAALTLFTLCNVYFFINAQNFINYASWSLASISSCSGFWFREAWKARGLREVSDLFHFLVMIELREWTSLTS